MKNTKDTMKAFVDYAQPVILEIKKRHNQFIKLDNYAFSPEDLYAKDGCIEYEVFDPKAKIHKYDPEHYDGPINAIYAQWGEETGAALLLEITPEVRGLLSQDVIDVLCDRGEEGDIEFIKSWDELGDQTVYFFLDHHYYLYNSGFELSNEDDQMHGYLGDGLTFLTRRLGISYLNESIDDLLYLHGWGFK